MSDNVVAKVNDLAETIGVDQLRQDKLLNRLIPSDADPLTDKVLVMTGTAKKTGFLVNDPTATYKAGELAGAQVDYLINTPTFTLSTPDTTTAVNAGDLGTLALRINGNVIDSFDLASAFDASQEDQAQSYPPANSPAGKITIISVDRYQQVWQKLNAKAQLVGTDLRRGYNRIELIHTDTAEGEQVSATYEVFYDDAPTNPIMQAVSLAIHNEVTRAVSGVNYLAKDAVVKVSTVISSLVDNSYAATAIQFYNLAGAPTTSMGVTDSSITGLSTPPHVGELTTVTDKLITLSRSNQCSNDARLIGRPADPFGVYSTQTSPSQNLLISTFASTSTASQESFNDENYRLPLSWDPDDKTSAVTAQWDSGALIAEGNAQQFISGDHQHALMYPSIDFSHHSPANVANYSGRSGPVQYLRAITTSTAKSSIQLILDGVAGGVGQVGSGDINIEIRLPGETGWLDCAKPYNGTSTNENDGCLVGDISYLSSKAIINATFGTKSSFGSNNRCYVRITLNNGSRAIHAINTNW